MGARSPSARRMLSRSFLGREIAQHLRTTAQDTAIRTTTKSSAFSCWATTSAPRASSLRTRPSARTIQADEPSSAKCSTASSAPAHRRRAALPRPATPVAPSRRPSDPRRAAKERPGAASRSCRPSSRSGRNERGQVEAPGPQSGPRTPNRSPDLQVRGRAFRTLAPVPPSPSPSRTGRRSNLAREHPGDGHPQHHPRLLRRRRRAGFDDVERAVEAGVRMARDGADIIDIGGESTRPGAGMPAQRRRELRRCCRSSNASPGVIQVPISSRHLQGRVAARPSSAAPRS